MTEIALTGICLAPLLFLTEKGPLRYLAALAGVLWLLVKVPARLNAAAAMQDSLGDGKLFSLRLADPGNYGKKIGYAFGRLGLLVLWSLPMIAALLYAWEMYAGQSANGLTVLDMIYQFGGQDMKTGILYLLLILLGLVLIAALGTGGYFGYKHVFGEKAPAVSKDAIITASLLDDLPAHTILIPGEEGTTIYIRELHASYTVLDGFATVEVADHTWYDNLEGALDETMQVTLTPFLKNASGKGIEQVYSGGIPEYFTLFQHIPAANRDIPA